MDLSDILFDRLHETPEGCWEYVGARSSTGYGAITVNRITRGTHVVAYELWCGPVTKGMFVCHHCDNPPCCNPDHLFLGTPLTNKMDEMAKDRNVYGTRVGNSKLLECDVIEIKGLLSDGQYSLQHIADIFGVTKQNIYRIKYGLTWRHLQ